MNILLNLPYYTGSHKVWADNLVKHSKYSVKLITMSGRHWKWRMQGSSIHLAREFEKINDSQKPDLIICSTMMDVALYKSLISVKTPIIYYLHENQLTYPFSDEDDRKEEFHYGFINYKSCLAADSIAFNSNFHRKVFIEALEKLLRRLPDYQNIDFSLNLIQKKSKVLWVGFEYEKISELLLKADLKKTNKDSIPKILWNHRWDQDKNPSLFLKLLYFLRSKNLNFQLVLLGSNSDFSIHYKEILQVFNNQIIHFGYVKNFEEYINLMATCDIYPVCSNQDFYGISVLEAICCGITPTLPRNRVYTEFFDESAYTELYFSDEKELFSKVEIHIKEFSNTNPSILKNRLKKQDIHNVIKDFDLHISRVINS